MKNNGIKKVNILKSKGKKILDEEDFVATERPLEILLGQSGISGRDYLPYSVTLRTPSDDFELVIGLLFAEGIIQSSDDISLIRYLEQGSELAGDSILVELKDSAFFPSGKNRNLLSNTACGICGKASLAEMPPLPFPVREKSKHKISIELLTRLPKHLARPESLFALTGGIHATAMFDLDGRLMVIKEDIGRHNALDKLIGSALKQSLLPLDNHIILLSGRIGYELVQKSLMAGVRILAALGAPSSAAVELAEEFDMTLVGFLKESRMNVYSGREGIAH